MLKTALKPQWIAGLVLALVVSAVFVLLGKWQMDNSASAPPPLTQTETPVELTEHFVPEKAMYGTEADQVVTMTGSFVPDTDVFIHPRLHGGQDGTEGYWVVSAFQVDGAPNGEVMPVVRGWTASTAETDPAPQGDLHITGRLLPAEGPSPEGIQHTADGTVLTNLASSELINLWDVRSYAGYVAAFDVVATGGPGAPDSGQEVGAKAEGGALEPVLVGPQPQETTYNWMNIFYAIEWVVFAGFAIFLWWRFLRDDYLRSQDEDELDRQWAEEWRAAELERRRTEALEAKRKAIEEYEQYYGASTAPTSAQQTQQTQQTQENQ